MNLDNISIHFSPQTGLNDKAPDLDFELFPNPSKGKYQLIAPDVIECIKIYNSLGELILYKEIGDIKTLIDITNHPRGAYFIHVKSVDDIIWIEKIINI